ncbi:hypothetical protein OHC33_010524 [Knufia fluminis]|uniref:Major facilitator superfamily (MFS) profile domain-containing protein n=1 Tax=Knufia fluminis TaxID=191047 RepID=A0AAN8E9J4_9EURO|nr:hypothetical protein OHC33_010524 [Knufia fluminis]
MAPRRLSTMNDNGGGSSTMTMEMPSYPQESSKTAPWRLQQPSSEDTNKTGSVKLDDYEEATLPSPTTANTTPQLQRWNHPRTNVYRVLATFWCFTILGANDAAYGALIPYLETYYNVDYLTISLVFLSPIVGYSAAALTNNIVHMRFGQRGVAAIMSVSHLIAYIIISIHPPYPALVVVFMLAGYGNGLGDSAWNAWIGDMANANEVLGFLHGMYGLGACISPLIATAVITQAGWQWYEFYYFLIGAAAIEVFILTAAFWKSTGAVYKAQHTASLTAHPDAPEQGSGAATPTSTEPSRKQQAPLTQRLNPFHEHFFMNHPLRSPNKARSPPGPVASSLHKLNPFKNASSATAEAVNNRVTILAAVFLLFYVGAEVSIGGWIVTFMLRVRHGTDFASGIVATGFWLGVTVGRFVLGFVTARCFPTEKHAVAFYLVACIALQLLFWLIPSFNVSAVMVGLLGFFIAPMFPAAVVALTKLLPKRLHVAAVGFAAAVGASGATVLPFAVGAIANSRGVQVLQPVVLALLATILLIWLLLPKLPKQRMA